MPVFRVGDARYDDRGGALKSFQGSLCGGPEKTRPPPKVQRVNQ